MPYYAAFLREPIADDLDAVAPTTAAQDRRHMGRVAALGCIVCDYVLGIPASPAEVHHIRTGQGKKRAADTKTIPLCPPHHRHGRAAFHQIGRKAWERLHGITELELLQIVERRLGVA